MGRRRKQIKTRTNGSGYRQFWDEETGRWEYTHRRVAEKKMGGRIRSGYEVHHKDGDKTNNRPDNLVALPRHEHREVHQLKNEIEAKQDRARYASARAKREIRREIDELEGEIHDRESYYRGRR